MALISLNPKLRPWPAKGWIICAASPIAKILLLNTWSKDFDFRLNDFLGSKAESTVNFLFILS